jgi:hypothetical protein
MLRVTLPPAGFGDKLIDITGLLTLGEILDIQVEIHWIILEPKERFAYSSNLICIPIDLNQNPTKCIVPRREGAFANTTELETSGVFSPSIVKQALASLGRPISNDLDLLMITNKWLRTLRGIKLNPHIVSLVPAAVKGSIGIHLRRSDKLRNDGMLSWNDMDLLHYDKMINSLMHRVFELVSMHNSGEVLTFYICSEDLPFKSKFRTWLEGCAKAHGKSEQISIITIEKEDIPAQLLADYNNIFDVVEWYALTQCRCIFQGINYSTFSMTASMWADIPLHNFTETCSENWLTHLWKPCLKLIHCDKQYNHVVNYKTLSRFNLIAPILPKYILTYTLCKVFCLTKNEYDLIEDFIVFYGSLLGYGNVVLIDNGSTHPLVPEIYKKYENRGVRIHYDNRQMRKQADIMTDCMRLYQDECEFMLPLDTDEFIYTLNGKPLSPDTISNILVDVPKVFSGIFYKHVMDAVVDPSDPSYQNFCHTNPIRTMTKFKVSSIQKVIVRSSAFNYMIMGNHEANTFYGYRMICNDLALLHFNNTGPARKYERALQTITELGFIKPDLNNIPQLLVDCKAFVPCVGGHAYEQFISFLIRMLASSIWMQTHNRLPTPEEVHSVDQLRDAPDVIDRIHMISRLSKPQDTPGTKDRGVYDVMFGNWPTVAWEVEIDQVARYLRTLQKQ